MALTHAPTTAQPGLLTRLNTTWHEKAMLAFAAIIALHWVEHLVQAFQVWVLERPRPESRGVLGQFFPVLVSSEWLHYGYAVVMLVGLIVLMPGMTGRARTFWAVALGVQVWHFFEHALLLYQAQFHHNLFGGAVPTSVLQAAFPSARVEIHLFYNTLVTIPMLFATYFHLFPPRSESKAGQEGGAGAACSCARV